MKVLVGLSGGVDSSATAALLNEKYEICGATLRLFCDGVCKEKSLENEAGAKRICDTLGCGHIVLSYIDEFKKYVVDGFIEDYKNALTPNPCINCNKYLKFGLMAEYARKNGFDKIATGHYAKIEEKNGKFYLKKAADLSKDQTYVLYNLNQDILKRLLLPLGDYTKPQCREIAASYGFHTAASKESQDICFVPDGDYAGFIERYIGKYPKGRYINTSGETLGENKGIIHYTVGQRKGLGIALGKPAFVTCKNAADNTVTLGENSDLFFKTVVIRDVNYITDEIADGSVIEAKIRYSQTTAKAVFHKTASGQVELEFQEPQRAPTPGQSAVFYDGEYCLGGGIITGGKK